jgi:hypothetical protein
MTTDMAERRAPNEIRQPRRWMQKIENKDEERA